MISGFNAAAFAEESLQWKSYNAVYYLLRLSKMKVNVNHADLQRKWEEKQKMKVVKDLSVEKENQRQGNLHDWKKERTKYVQVDKEMQMKLSYPKIRNRAGTKEEKLSRRLGLLKARKSSFLLPWNCKKYEFPKEW